MQSALFQEIKAYIGFGTSDEANLAAMSDKLRPHVARVVDSFYQVLLRDEEARNLLTNDSQIERLRESLKRWIGELFSGSYGDAYFESRLRIGLVHVRIGLPQRYMPLAMEVVCEEFEAVLRECGAPCEWSASLRRLLTLDLTIMLGSFQERHIEQIREFERSTMEAKLASAQHLAEVGQLAASLAHEIKNPLAGISSAIQVIGDSLPANNRFRPVIQDILGQISRLDATVKDLLMYSRPSAPELRLVRLDKTVPSLFSLLRREPALRRVELRYEGPGVSVMADGRQVEQVLINLILNAAHASPDGAAVEVRASESSDYVTITVQDWGAGMPPNVLARAMEPFYTSRAKGTGLGLAICRRIVEAHKGRISLESEPGEGTVVTVELPTRGAVREMNDGR